MTEPPPKWYASLGAKYLDIVGDYAGKEMFFIEGDSLLLECFSDPQLDFEPGFQMLHAVYLVEKYLHNLRSRACSFDLVFFEENSTLCVPAGSLCPPKYELTRAIIINHLKTHTMDAQVLEFKNLNDPNFFKYLQDSAVLFALCSDGASYKYSSHQSLQLHGHSLQSNKNLPDRDTKIKLRQIIFLLMNKMSLDVALLNGLSWQDSKVFAFVLERQFTPRQQSPISDPVLEDLSLSEKKSDWKEDICFEEVMAVARTELDGMGLPLSSRMVITLRLLYNLPSGYGAFALPHVLHTLCQECLPLSARALPRLMFGPDMEKKFNDYMDFVARHCVQIFQLCDIGKDHTIVDLLDGRLLRLTVQLSTCSSILLPEELVTIAHRLTQALFRQPRLSLSPTELQVSIPAVSAVVLLSDEVLPFSHPAFDSHLRQIQLSVRNRKVLSTGKPALELTHWHNSKKLISARGQELRRSPQEEARAQRQHQRNIAQLTGYAYSLTGKITGLLDPKLIRLDENQSKSGKGRSKKASGQPPVQVLPKQATKPNNSKHAKSVRLTGQSKKDESQPEATSVGHDEPVINPNQLTEYLTDHGPKLERSTDAQDDARVPFKPDPWQVKVLDEIDSGNSLLVCAPTSAGKTFISFYAMEKALRTSDNAVLVYVAPTKALVNQIAAEVLAKFTKKYPYPGPTVYSIFTRDHRIHDPLKAQILVTVPHILQIMLMAPSNQAWVPRIKTIIFDEVHSISQADDGLVWEQLLISAPSQIIALSATIGNTAEFGGWLSAVQESTGRGFSLIQHEDRYSDLRKYVHSYDTLPVDLSMGLTQPVNIGITESTGIDKIKSMKRIHPAACLNHPQRGMPPDLGLESDDCLRLWESMCRHQSPPYVVPSRLHPNSFFGTKKPARADVLRWSSELKNHLADWMTERENSPFFKVVDDLKDGIDSTASSSTPNQKVDKKAAKNKTADRLLSSTLPLICDLRNNDALPAILFNFNRAGCEDIVLHLHAQLVDAESKFKENDPQWKIKIAKYTEWQKNAPIRERETRSEEKAASKAKKSKKSREQGMDKGAEKDSSRDGFGSKTDRALAKYSGKDLFFETFDPEAPLDRFSFANIKKADKELLETSIWHMKRAEIPKPLINAFRRGICVHHAGMNRWYRQAAEMFFRRGFLTVVIATGTLSLGINMPCKTVVFSGDSAFLTALNYRQCSGRAGRRGFDLLGNVVFQDIPAEKALRLMSSKLPDINGHFPLTTIFVLRLLSLLHGTKNAQYAMDMVDALLSKPRLLQGGEEFKHQVLHHVRFSIEYLRTRDLLNAQGHPIGFASCVSHLYFVERGALAFHALLKADYFHELVVEYSADEEHTLRKLLLVLAHLFGRRPMRPAMSTEEQEFIKKSVSLIILPEIPSSAATILKLHNEQTLRTYRSYVSTFVDQHCKEPDATLPFTKTPISSGLTKMGTGDLPHSRPAPRLRSPFVALSGHTDDFGSLSELCDTVRSGVFLEKAVIPYLDMGDELTSPLNAYLYDFYISGSVKALIEANRIARGEIWFLLKDFSLVLATIITAIENFLNPQLDGDMALVDDGDDGADKSESDEMDDTSTEVNQTSSRPDSPAISLSSTLVTPRLSTNGDSVSSLKVPAKPTTKLSKGNKAKVLDSWDDEDSEAGDEDVEEEVEELDEPAKQKAGEKAERELRKVYKMFKALQTAFEVKFKKMWA